MKNNNICIVPYTSSFEAGLSKQMAYLLFVMSLLYTASFLPYGRFYNRLGGNITTLASYLYVLMYLSFQSVREVS